MQLSPSRQVQRGLSLVELMVGITIGLIITAGASMVAVNQIGEHRRLTLETQIQQDLRTAADLIQQDLRRIGFRGQPTDGVWAPGSTGATPTAPTPAEPNPYADLVSSTEDDGNTVVHSYSYATQLDSSGLYPHNSGPTSQERFGVRWSKSLGQLSLQLGLKADGTPNWQAITDPSLMVITAFAMTPVVQTVALTDFCDPCPAGVVCTPPAVPASLVVRQYNFTITAQAVHDRNVIRTITGTERVRADAQGGACPTW